MSLPATQTTKALALSFRIAFINAGNRPAIVVDAKERCFKGTAEQPLPEATGEVLAKYRLILSPNEVKVVDVNTQLPDAGPDGFYCSLEFLSIDSRGTDHAFKADAVFSVKEQGQDTWQVHAFGDRPRPVMRLFGSVDRS